ncbi:hypothetical protein BKA70DRAFT_1523141 [Coprinopsis sp. MPI-PUGE-AT-0042]|nr:hypothetical protein BKA70DRAFT_1523141 [Coprinopsis sp. MPI-PUGE-AT-0042]
MRWSLPLYKLALVLTVANLNLALALPIARGYDSLVPRIKGATNLDDIKSETYRETAKMSSIQINPDRTRTRLTTAEERKADGESKFTDGDSQADHGLEKQQIPKFLSKNGLPRFDDLNKSTREQVNKVINDVKNFAWIPSGLNSSKKHAIGQAMDGKQVSTVNPERSSYLKGIYNRVKRVAHEVEKAVRKDSGYNKKLDNRKVDGKYVSFTDINRQHYETAGILKKGEKSPASTPGHTPFSSPGGSPVSGPSSPIAGSSKLTPPSPGGSAHGKSSAPPRGPSNASQAAAGSSTNLGKHGRSTSEASAGRDKGSKKGKEGSPPPTSKPGSPSNKFAGLPKLNTNLSKSSNPSSPQSARDKGKSVQRSPKTSSPKTSASRSPTSKSPASPRPKGSVSRPLSRSSLRARLSPKPKPMAGATYGAKAATKPAAKGGKGRK